MSERVATVRATVRTWRHMARTQAAFKGAGWSSYGPLMEPEIVERVTRVWLADDCGREESEDGEVFVWRGSDWWRHDAFQGARSNENVPREGPLLSEFDWLRGAAAWLETFDRDAPVPCRRAGRGAQAVRGVPNRGHGDEPVGFGLAAADEVLLELDAERGTPLRIEARFAGEPFSILEVVEIAFDETVADAAFVFTPPPGVEVRSILEDQPVWWGLTLEQAVAAAPFPLWIPAEDGEVEIAYAREEAEPPAAPQVHLVYATAGIRLAQSPVGHPGEQAEIVFAEAGPWRVTERNGRPMEVREGEQSRVPAQVCLELEGTWIFIHSDELEVDELADVAGSLRRAG